MLFWLELSQWFRSRRFFNFVNVFSLFRNYLPLEKGVALHMNKFESPSPNGCIVPSLVEIGPMVLEKFFLISSMYFSYFVIISHWKRVWSFIIIQKMKPPSTKNTFCSVWLKSAPWFWKKKMKT